MNCRFKYLQQRVSALESRLQAQYKGVYKYIKYSAIMALHYKLFKMIVI